VKLTNSIESLAGPILIIGASGFVGANLLRACLTVRQDVVGTTFSGKPWRLHGIATENVDYLNLQDPVSVRSILGRYAPRTIFDCSSFGAYSFEEDYDRIHATNYTSFLRLMEELADADIAAYVHAGSSSEYGLNAAAPAESDALLPNSHYALSKAAAGHAIAYFGKVRGIPVVNLRLYSVYGPYEDSSRLIPVLCARSLEGQLPDLAHPEVTRDFIHIDDVVAAFVESACAMSPALAGESLNIGTGKATSLQELAELCQRLFRLDAAPRFDARAGRDWDTGNWHADPGKARQLLGWQARIGLEEGIASTRDWWQAFLQHSAFGELTKRSLPGAGKNSVSAIIACYRDAEAIPIMYRRLVDVFRRLGMNYEIIFVNDASPDNSTEVIRQISATDPNVLGILHSRNFGSQAAFRSGMQMATTEACVLMDGDLQDPPELIEAFVTQWRDGADVVYGRRVKREMPLWLESLYRGFYRVFAAMSDIPIPRDAGDFSLIDRTVVYWMLECQERDSFLRGLRAYVGFKQVGVDYVRPERAFGVSTNNWIKNLGWAKKGIFSFSRMPLHIMTALGGVTLAGTAVLATWSVAIKLFAPESAPRGITFLALLVMTFGSITIFSLGLLGEYIGKIFEETKARPAFIQRNIIARGEVKPVVKRKRP